MRSSLRRVQKNPRARKVTAITVVASLIAGAFAVGLTAQVAAAAPWIPSISAQSVDPVDAGKDFVLAGEDVGFDISVTNDGGGAQFNLSLVAVVPANVEFVDAGVFGTPTIFAAGDVLPNRSRTAADASCASLGLVDAPGQAPLCAVPAGQQVWVWSNVNDLPQGGTVSSRITVSPIDDDYPVGTEVAFSIRAYTSNDPARLPTYDGSPSVSRTTAHTSGVGTAEDDVPVRAVRILKSEPSSEDELLRGVHDHITTYTLRVDNTARGATDAVTVTDYLPAGLEYLGLATSGDNSTTGEEYDSSGPLVGGTTIGETVDTVQITAAEAAALGLAGAGVYTKVTWTYPVLDAGSTTVITYNAAVPLFANALWPDGTAPTAASGGQAANLDNNTGASTRHGDPSTATTAQTFRNVAVVAGDYQGPVLNDDDAFRAATDDDDEIIEAVDVKVVKGVDVGGLFTTGDVATYSVDVQVSEYVDARGIVLTDVIPNGLCPAFPTDPAGVALMIGATEVPQDVWNSQVPGDACNFPTEASGAVLSDELTVASIRYEPSDGTFTVTFVVDDIPANGRIVGHYSVMQRPNYTGAGGGTSSGDRFLNRVTVTAQTDPIAPIASDPELSDRVGETYFASDDSQALITSESAALTKTVLERGRTPQTASPSDWVDEATQPFSPGDDVWYRIEVPFATGIDTRNPLLTDYLPEGVGLVEIQYGYTGIPGFADVAGPVAPEAGVFPSAFIPNPPASGSSVTWEFGSRNRTGSGDRFMPDGSTVTIYLRGVVQTQSASRDDVDSPLNQAKYQQVNVDGELTFLRADAGIDLDWGSTLTKGIRALNDDEIGSTFGARVPSAEVVQGDRVEYRIDVEAPQNSTSDYVIWDVLPAGVTSADVGAEAAYFHDGAATPSSTPIASGQWQAVAYDAGDELPSGISLGSAYEGRSVIVWTIDASVAGSTAAVGTAPETVRGLSLGYVLTVPSGVDGGGDAAQITQSYVNTAGIVSYGIENVGGETTTVVPQADGGGQQLTTRTPQTGEIPTSDENTVGTAEVHLPDVAVTKTLVSTEVGPTDGAPSGEVDLGDGPRNTAAQIVQGEYATFEYSVTIPANTTVTGAVLSDGGALTLSSGGAIDYEFVDGSAVFLRGAAGTPIVSGTGASDFRTAQSSGTVHGVLTFPDVYTNSTSEPEIFRVQISAWVTDRDDAAANSEATDIRHRTTLTNTATLTFLDPNSPSGTTATRADSADVQFIQPQPTLTKTPSSTEVSAAGEVTYTLTASDLSGRPALHDVVVIDCVPREITPSDLQPSTGQASILAESCAIADDGAVERGAGSGTLIEWEVGTILGSGVAPTLTYTGTIEAGAGGGSSFTNHAELTGYTLPTSLGDDTDTTDRRGVYTAAADATVSMPQASIDKTVSPGEASVGDVVTYTLTTLLPASTNFYDVVLSDRLPAGVEYVAGGAQTETVDWAGGPAEPTVSAPTLDDRTLTWSIDSDDIAAWVEPRTITVTFQARITDAVQDAAPVNTGAFAWSRIDGSTSPGDRDEDSSSIPVVILNPEVTIAKSVKIAGADDSTYAPTAAGDPDAAFTYRVQVANRVGAGTAPAYDVVVTDTVEAGIRIDTEQSVFDGATFSDETALQQGRGGTITWTIAGPISNLSGSNTREFVYQGTFADSAELDGQGLDNDVAVQEYSSAADDGWTYTPGGTRPGGSTVSATDTTDTATTTPRFPFVELSKRVTAGSEAFVGESFSWTLEAVNTGQGSAQTITLTDTLPLNWEYDDSVSPRLSVGGRPAADLDAPVLGTDGDRQTLTWIIGSDTADALLPGIATAADAASRTLTVTFSSTPLDDAVVDPGADLSIDHRNSVAGEVTDTTDASENAAGTYAGDDATADAHIARADLEVVKEAIGGVDGSWIAGAAAGPDYAQPQWRITVTNQGPDDSHGSFRVTDTTDLPDGVTTGSFSAVYHADADDTEGVPLALSGTGTDDDPFVVGDRTLTLSADGTDRIALIADVSIGDAVTGAATNTASVIGRTFETPEDITRDNTSEVTKPISSVADLVITKSVSTLEPTAGRPVTWSILVRNDGPSVSASVAGDRITVTDTIPAGIGEVQDPTPGLTEWTVAASDGWPAAAGDTVTWTFTGSGLAVGPAQELALTGTIDSSWTGGEILNRAVVEPGPTPDGDESNNVSEVPVAPGDDTTLAITKTRVVDDGGVWKDAAQLGADLPDVVAGESVSYRVVVTNNGPADAREVTVVDEVPDMLAFAGVEDETGTWTRTAGPGTDDTFALTGTVPPTAGSNTRSFVVTYTVADAMVPGTEIVNWVTASASNSTNTPRDSDSNDSDRIAELAIVKQAVADDGTPVADDVIPEVTAGTQTRFLLTVTNHGPSISGAPIEVADRLPAGMTYISSTIDVAGAGAVEAAPLVSDDRTSIAWDALTGDATLQVGETIVIEVTASVAADVRPQRLVNTAEVTGPDDVDPSNNSDDASVDVVSLAEMSVTKTVADGPWIAGTDVEYTITVTNDGPSVADATVTDLLPSGLTAVSIDGVGWTCDDATETCTRAAHPLGESTITVIAHIDSDVPTGTVLTNTATLSWTDSRSTSPHEDADEAVIDVTTDADLTLVKTAIDADEGETSSAVAGENARYRIAVDNLGPSDAVGPITVTDVLPAGSSFVGLVGASADSWIVDAVDEETRTVTFTLRPAETGLANGAAAPALDIEVRIDPSVEHGSVLTNTAEVSSETPDSNPENDGDTADLTIVREVDLAITKTHDADAVRIGDDLDFALEVRNAGPSVATEVVVTDVVPAGLEVTTRVGDDVGEGWTVESVEPVDAEDQAAGTRVVARYAVALAPGEAASVLTVSTRVLVEAYSEVVNVADVTAAEITDAHPDRTPEDNSAQDAVSVPPLAALLVTKTAVGSFQVGTEGEYRIVVRNAGPTADPGPITVTDSLPEGLGFAGSPDAGVQVDGRVVTWVLDDGLAVGEEIALTLRVTVGEGAYPSVTNIVAVDSPTEQTEEAVLIAEAMVDVAAADPLATTGAELTWGLIAMAMLLLVSGGLFAASRRRSEVAAD